jgi:hypothetical protein
MLLGMVAICSCSELHCMLQNIIVFYTHRVFARGGVNLAVSLKMNL